MNRSQLKVYAPRARRDFIAAVTARAHLLGISETEIAPSERHGSIAIIAGREWPAKVGNQRDRLIERIKRAGFAQTMEAVAYTWFNRFAALRFMELHDYLGHSHRVLSSRDGGLPELIAYASEIDLPGLQKAEAMEMQLAGNKDGELYRRLLVAQCNALSSAMPFLFEYIDDETELLLPDNLLHSDSLVRKFVTEIEEEDWRDVEIIGWLYQFYISEKKDEVIGNVVKSEDIPAATQLFTPSWIVKYLVQNSVGRLWLTANPTSTLISRCPYYIVPVAQTPEVQAQLDALIESRIDDNGDSLNPETIRVLDPACGSGHILLEAYEVLKAIYLERGYRPRDIPRLILAKNLYGLDIDDRAAQLAGFALLMKARADDRSLLDDPPTLNVRALREGNALHLDEIATHLAAFGIKRSSLERLLNVFALAKTFGSLIQLPKELNTELGTISDALQQAIQKGDIYAQAAAQELFPLVKQAQILGMEFDAVIANPPYMGSKGMNSTLKEFVSKTYPEGKSDLMTCFMDRCRISASRTGYVAMINLPSWLFLSSFETFRHTLLSESSISSFLHLGRGVFGSDFGSVAFVLNNTPGINLVGIYRRLFESQSEVSSIEEIERLYLRSSFGTYLTAQCEFLQLPGCPIAYWASAQMRSIFKNCDPLEKLADARIGMATGHNQTYVRYWFEVSHPTIGFHVGSRIEAKASLKKWFPYAKGGEFRKWYGNSECVVDWSRDGFALQTTKHPDGKRIWAHNFNLEQIFRPSICWTVVTIAETGFRYHPVGYVFDAAAGICQPKDASDMFFLLGILNSKIAGAALKIINPTVNLHPGYLGRVPVDGRFRSEIASVVKECIDLAKADWDDAETSWDFRAFPLLRPEIRKRSLESTFSTWLTDNEAVIKRMQHLESENNRYLIEAYKLRGELSSEVAEQKITLARADRETDCRHLISYAIGCMMGRYSLDEPGVIYAQADNIGFDHNRYHSFPADTDGIVPLTDELWFEDDVANRIGDFLIEVWGAETLGKNTAWLAESLGRKGNETPEETIRRYLSTGFFKDHLQTYKKRPIYWLFSSGKNKAFECLVYQHRYNETTLARMRTTYVVPLTSKIAGRIELLQNDFDTSSSATSRAKLQKQIESLRKKQVELLVFDEKLRHYADMRIKLDLDVGVKVNYGKFGDLLADTKSVTGGEDA